MSISSGETKFVWSFNKFLPQFGKALSAEEYLLKNDSKYTIVQYYSFLEREYSEPLKRCFESVYQDLNIPIDIVNIITTYNSGGIIYDYTKSFEQYTNGKVVYMTPIILGYIETALFLSLFITMYLMHFQYKYNLFPSSTAYQTLTQCLLFFAISYSFSLFIHTVCVIISYHQCRKYEVIIRNFKRSLYANKNFSHHVRMINMKEIIHNTQTAEDHEDDDHSDSDIDDDEEEEEHQTAADHEAPSGLANTPTNNDEHRHLRIDIDGDFETVPLDGHRARDADGVPTYHHMLSYSTQSTSNVGQQSVGGHSHNTSPTPSASSGDIMDRWQYTTTYKETQQKNYLSILNPSNNSFAYVAYQRWLNVKKLELENDSFTRSKSALVLNLSKYWLTSYFTLIIILIFIIPNSVYLYFAFVLTLFVMYYCYLRTIKNLDHPAALKKVLYLFCSFVIGTIITLIIIFTTEDTALSAAPSSDSSTSSAANSSPATSPPSSDRDTAASINHASEVGGDNDVTFWIFDVIFPILEGIFALLYSWITVGLVYKICRYDHQGYHLWLCSVNAFGFWLLTFWIPSWKITELSIACTLCLLIACYLYLQQISHRIMTGLDKQEYIAKHCAPNPKQWLKQEIIALFVPYNIFHADSDQK